MTIITRSLLLSLALLAVAATACASPEPTPTSTAPTPTQPEALTVLPDVQPLANIVVSGPTFTNLQPRSVSVLLDTSISVVCAAAYGKTDSYGQLATDTDMAGAGHQSHHPVLSNLEPDTEYHIRLQGMGPDGILYQSQDYTIRTPPAQADEPQRPSGENLALLSNGARVVAVSSNFGSGGNDTTFGANKAIDGKQTTAWSTDGDGDDAWIEIQLEGEAHVSALGFQTRTMGSSAQIFTFQVVTDRNETLGPFTLEDAANIHYFSTDFTASRLRFEAIETSGGNTGAVEIEIYGELEMDTAGM